MVLGVSSASGLAPHLRRFDGNRAGRDFAVGDVHGYFEALAAGLQAIGFDATRDRLFCTGDLVDRGPQSAQVLDWLARPWFHAVRGNHEAMACAALAKADTDWQRFHATHGGAWLHDLPPALRQRIGATLAALPLAIEVQTAGGPVGIVHADLPSDDWHDMCRLDLSEREASHCLWSLERFAHGYTGRVRHARAVVHGHATTPRMRVLGNVHFIDTHHSARPPGEQGHFTFLELASLRAHRGPGGEWAPRPPRRR